MAGSQTLQDLEVQGAFIPPSHTAGKTDAGYDGEEWTVYEKGQLTTRRYSHDAQRWYELGPLFQDTQLTASNVNNLLATNITLVTAPPAGFALYPTEVHFFMDFGTAAFVQAAGSDALAIRYSASTEIQELGSEAQMTALLEAAADAALIVPITSAVVPVTDVALDLDNNGASEYTTGDGTLSVRVYYRIVPMAAFS